jgi:hypothetical protein
MIPTIPNAGQDPRLTEKLLEANAQRRKLSIDQHDQLRREMLGGLVDERDFDDIDELIEIDPYVSGTSNRRSDKELSKILDLIDNLPISSNGKDGRH